MYFLMTSSVTLNCCCWRTAAARCRRRRARRGTPTTRRPRGPAGDGPIAAWARVSAAGSKRCPVSAVRSQRTRDGWQLDSTAAKHHDAMMRTTVTLEPDLAVKIKALAHRRGLSFKQTLNELIRRGLSA